MKKFPPERIPQCLEFLRKALSVEASVEFAFLLGSAGRGEPFRDLDIAYVGRDADAETLPAVLALAARLERHLRLPIDLIPLSKASASFGHRASQGILLTHRDADRLARWKEDIWTRHFDEGPRLAVHGREIIKAARGRC